MAPHQKHYRAKMRKHGWMNEAGEIIWPASHEERQKMVRGLFGVELVSNVDYWTLLAEDELDGTYQAPWASQDRERLEVAERREIFKTLSKEQREAVRELLRKTTKGHLHSFCVALDQKLGGSTIVLEHLKEMQGEHLEIHSSRQADLCHEGLQWLEDYSIIFGKDERYETEA